jgi:hypothetical protein
MRVRTGEASGSRGRKSNFFERMSEKLLLTHLPTGDPPKIPLKKGDFK